MDICFENNFFETNKILVQPKIKGKFTYIALEVDYNIFWTVAELQFDVKYIKSLWVIGNQLIYSSICR